jgi:transcriptional regulator with XRE-family HTH domain
VKPEEAFGLVLREIRSDKGFSQEKLALNCDLDRTFISMLERGVRQPSLTSILAISATLEIPAHKLVKLTTDLLDDAG